MKKEEMRDVELIIGKILRVGVIVSAAVIILGVVLYFINGGTGYADGEWPRRFGMIFSGIAHGKSYAVIMLGIFLLILTPVLRVVVSIYAFAKEHDRLYVYITTAVLIILIIAMVFGYNG
ncbi:DUF1634 domain-containing protein [Companilactobacillus sp.]|jgi:uncharacterized membrane protein|uniref:DUF1634 domain-containing protein n=1 Tax=Companilactobacillus sp. TaxID=2767905 RepID=UPI0025BB747C|nr:DUF1634 domain-containing protein [Companilactobacillus sp.]MCH4009485.1 DUF1634 domain-containing protein [Companilactobacillus sp.]MCH4052839.1 DUF1634 domain-containing protein [Companilactobacillus sp.]MCH4077427.1 DUF1634 domain-containing protein [Companilactobacillus sp.]MCH4126003.1 DUF1634 domain-containing protein [Companilactobacillus sp.]MCI1311711.1 DUF1634 domain-containing protein [Companilactobacillus sp.]